MWQFNYSFSDSDGDFTIRFRSYDTLVKFIDIFLSKICSDDFSRDTILNLSIKRIEDI